MPDEKELLCPSAPAGAESVLIGVLSGTREEPRIIPTEEAMPVDQAIIELARPASPSEVFRFASTCKTSACIHFKNAACQIAARSTELLDEVAQRLPHCSIRSQCRWFHQEGPDMCRRCPQIVTKQYAPSAVVLQIVNENDPPPPYKSS